MAPALVLLAPRPAPARGPSLGTLTSVVGAQTRAPPAREARGARRPVSPPVSSRPRPSGPSSRCLEASPLLEGWTFAGPAGPGGAAGSLVAASRPSSARRSSVTSSVQPSGLCVHAMEPIYDQSGRLSNPEASGARDRRRQRSSRRRSPLGRPRRGVDRAWSLRGAALAHQAVGPDGRDRPRRPRRSSPLATGRAAGRAAGGEIALGHERVHRQAVVLQVAVDASSVQVASEFTLTSPKAAGRQDHRPLGRLGGHPQTDRRPWPAHPRGTSLVGSALAKRVETPTRGQWSHPLGITPPTDPR